METTTNFQKHTSSNRIQNYLIRNFNSQILDDINSVQPHSLLDAGCGEGFIMKLISESGICAEVNGIDTSTVALRIARKINPDLRISKGSVYDIPYAKNTFDLVTCLEVLEHLEDPQKALCELIRVSKRYVLISVPNEPFFQIANFLRGKYIHSLGNHPEHINHWSSSGVASLLVGMNCKIIHVSTPFAWTIILAKKS